MPIAKASFRRLKRQQAEAGFQSLLDDALRRLVRDLFNIHAAFRRRHENVLADGAVEHDAQIQFAVDRQSLFDEHLLDDAAFGPGLMRDQRHAENFPGDDSSLRGIFGDLDAASFASSTGVDLRFDDNAAAELFRRCFCFFRGACHFPSRHGNAVAAKEGLGLILVNLHDLWGNLL